METSFVLYEQKENIGFLTINRPDALNALNSKLIAELTGVLDEISKSDIRALIITGAGERAFVAGADIAEMKDFSPKQALSFSQSGNKMMEKIENMPMPTIAAVGGFCLGGGFELALSCDLIIASEKALFGLPETTLGIMPGYGGVQKLCRAIGIAKAKELAFTAMRIGADKAFEMGIVNMVVPSENLAQEAEALAGKIAANAPVAVRAAKVIANQSIGLGFSEMCCLESELFSQCFATTDQKMAMSAYLEKKKPQPFEGK